MSFSTSPLSFPFSGTQPIAMSFSLQSEDEDSHFTSACIDSVLESLLASHPRHLSMCRMVAPWGSPYADAMEDISSVCDRGRFHQGLTGVNCRGDHCGCVGPIGVTSY